VNSQPAGVTASIALISDSIPGNNITCGVVGIAIIATDVDASLVSNLDS
jgi:hypothetical protein